MSIIGQAADTAIEPENPLYEEASDMGIELLQEVAVIVTDGDPDDKAQFKKLWQEKREQIFALGLLAGEDLAQEHLKDPTLRHFALGNLKLTVDVISGNTLEEIPEDAE